MQEQHKATNCPGSSVNALQYHNTAHMYSCTRVLVGTASRCVH